ncbi:MAG: PAS domain S-box protein [Desulfobacula sp.]|uniref:HD-GYP domain-containing protein n=1 Tax=Desulfobacula sp. TaxID=2593537 RepID=UPI0025B90BB1|nr:HD domain-containing phosphohydrolase [Desulfobacula sp.]MCD4721324.1 PAS domain S-box protein [Desulfobacula sp.]
MEKLTIDYHNALEFKNELNRFFNKRVYLLFWVGFILFPTFLILDYFVVNEYFQSFFVYRAVVSCSLLCLLFVHKKEYGRNHPFLISIAGYICCGTAISIMVVQTGGYDSFYYVGLICIVVAFSSILPLNFYQSIGSGILMYLIYVLPVLFFNEPETQSRLLFFNNNFFFLFFFIVSVVKSHEDYKSREKEFMLRKDLDYYAANLEKEVKIRIKRNEESELRYKELYENIIDSLVLIDSNGIILIANPNFYKLIKDEKAAGKRLSLMEFIHPKDLENVNNLMLDQLFRRVEIRDFQFRVINSQNEIIDMECSAKALQKSGDSIGYQLVLRDISFKKRLENDLINSFDTLKNTRAATIMGLATLTEYRDKDTGFHLERIQKYSKVLTTELGNFTGFHDTINDEYVENIHLSSILHDIGKVGIPDSILLKPGRLTSGEFNIIKKHCKYGGDTLKAVESKIKGKSFLILGREIAYFHHEKWNGKGYPYGIKSDEIPLSARIVAVCDVYDALTSKRIYKEAYSHNTALEIIQSEREQHFDPDIVDAFSASSSQFDLIRKQF